MKNERIVFLIVLLGILLRLPHIRMPLVDKNAWRQTDTAAVARNFFEEEFNLFYPRIDWRGDTEGYVEAEFQIYPFLVASLYKAAGVQEWLGRLLSLLFFVVSALLLHRLVLLVYSTRVANWAVFIFVVSPLNIHFSRAFLPTSLLVMCSVASIYFFAVWVEKDDLKCFLASALFTSLAVLVKLPSLYLGLPLLYMFYKKYGKSLALRWRVWLFGAIVLLPVLSWYLHAHRLFLKTHLTFGLWGEGYSKLGNPSYWLSLNFYWTLLSRAVVDLLPLAGIVLAAIGFFGKNPRKNYVFHWWAAAFIAYVFIAAEGHQTHYYYQMPAIPILSLFAGLGVVSFKKPMLMKSVGIGLAVYLAGAGLWRAQSYVRHDPDIIPFGKRIEQLTEKEDLLIIGGWRRGPHLQSEYPPGNPINFYFSHRKGWEIALHEWELALVDSLHARGADYFVSYYPRGMEQKPDFAQGMQEKYRLVEVTDRWVIYDLGPTIEE